MESTNSCLNCKAIPPSGSKKFLLHNIMPKLQKVTVFEALTEFFKLQHEHLSPLKEKSVEARFLCLNCTNKLRTCYKFLKEFHSLTVEDSYLHRKSIKPITVPSEPQPSNRKVVTPQKIILKKPITPVRSKLRFYQSKPLSLKIMQNQIGLMVRRELFQLRKHPVFSPQTKTTQCNLPSDADLENVLAEKAPLFYKILQGVLCSNMKTPKFVPQMRVMAAIGVHALNQKANAFQQSIGLLLYRAKATVKVYSVFRKLSLCCTYRTIENTLDRITGGFDKELNNFQTERENQLKDYVTAGNELSVADSENEEQSELRDLDDDVPIGSEASCSFGPTRKSKLKAARKIKFLPKPEMYFGGSFCFDNINHVQSVQHHYKSKKTKIAINMTSVVFIHNRIPIHTSKVLESEKNFPLAVDIPLHGFMPTTADFEVIKKDHVVLLKRILVKNLGIFKKLQNHDSVVWNIPHKYSKSSAKKTEVISLGIIDEEESSSKGMVGILKFLQLYLPTRPDGVEVVTVAHGDGLTSNLCKSTQEQRFNSDTKKEKLNGIVPSSGQWHLRVIFMQDLIKMLFGKSDGSPGVGTLPNLRAVFGHAEKLKDAKHNFNLAQQFFNFALESYACAYACQLLGINPIEMGDATNSEFSDLSIAELAEVLDRTAESIKDFEWHDLEKNYSQNLFCFCLKPFLEEDEEDYICCDNNYCKHQLWYHISCLKNQSVYFQPPKRNIQGTVWFCSKECEYETKDKKLLYSKAVLFTLLNQSMYRDAVRQNDGKRKMIYNKLHFVQSHNNNHYQYFGIIHYWLANRNGFNGPNVRHDMLYNSTVNISGKQGGNLEADLFQEFYNRYLKDMLMIPHGNMTKKSIQRRSRAFQIISDLTSEYLELLTGEAEDAYNHTRNPYAYRVDVPAASKIILTAKLLKHEGKRCHAGFENFQYRDLFLDNISAFKNKLSKRSKRLDSIREYQTEQREI